ncbi:hypothetical protein [Geobacter sp.]|uniref:hypothetical protein n=1 Tax=Geobacter sp. TaxID=46610 RepID=UPI0027BA81F6|nr:hypothetical protein [Geobacter sp.]
MSTVVERLKACLESGAWDPALTSEAIAEISELRKRQNELEMVLLMLVRTGWPWQEDGEPNEMYRNGKDGYVSAMGEAKELLGLGHLSMITRTEPRT